MPDYFTIRDNCPACNSRRTKVIFPPCKFTESPIKDFYRTTWHCKIEFEYLYEFMCDASYTLLKCYDCYLIWQRETPNTLLMNILYENLSRDNLLGMGEKELKQTFQLLHEKLDPGGAYVKYNDSEINCSPRIEKIVKELALWKTSNQRESKNNINYYCYLAEEILFILFYFKNRPDKIKVLDFGMGMGQWCSMARSFGLDVFGMEVSKQKINITKKEGIKVISYEEIQKYKFDFININQVFEHISNPLETLIYLTRSIKKNGIIKISVPNGGNIEKKIKLGNWTIPKGEKGSLNALRPLRHINCFNEHSLIRMAEKADLLKFRFPLSIDLSTSIGIKKILKNSVRYFYKALFPNIETRNYFYLP